MAIIVDFIRQYALWAYAACALVALWYLRVVFQARHERRNAVFTLERETAMNRVYGAWTATVFLLIVMGLIYLLSTVVSDAVRPLVEDGQPTAVLTGALLPEGTPSATPTLPLPEITPTLTATLRPRPTARPQPTLAPLDTATPAPQRPRCADPRAVITSPGINAQVSGPVTIMGTAMHAQFNYYKLEYGLGGSPTQWSFFAEGNQPITNGPLGVFNAALTLPPGTYSVRVVVVDATGNYVDPPCQTTFVLR